MCWGVNVSGCLDDGVEQHHSRLLGDDLFGGEVMLNELRDGGEAGAFKPVLTLPERERQVRGEESVSPESLTGLQFD